MKSQLILTFSIVMLFKFILTQNNYNIYDPYYAMNYLNSSTYSPAGLQYIIDSLSKTFEDAYAFNEISKNPPQPKFSENYYKKIDIQKRLKEINTKNTTVYKYYQDLKRALADLGDLHINFYLSKFVQIYTTIWPYQPLQFYIKMHMNKPRIFANCYVSNDIMNKFRNNETVFKVIMESYKFPIYSINGQDPFYYITNLD